MNTFKIENLTDIIRVKEVTRTEKIKNILNHNCVIEDFFCLGDLLVINMIKKSTGYKFQFLVDCINVNTYNLYVSFKYELFGEKSSFDWRELKWLAYSTLNQIQKIISDIFGDREFCRIKIGYAPDSLLLEEKGNEENYLILHFDTKYKYAILEEWLMGVGILPEPDINEYTNERFLPPHIGVEILENEKAFILKNKIQKGGDIVS